MNEYLDRNDVIVVGGGLAGLAAACYLARAGLRVTLLEKASEPGGRAETDAEDGYSLNRGAHALYGGGAAEEALKELGIQFTGGTPQGFFVRRDGRFYMAPASPLTLLRTGLLGMRAKLELMRIFTAIFKMEPGQLGGLSVQEWLDRQVKNPQVRRLMDVSASTSVFTTALDIASMDVMLTRFINAVKSPIRYVDGGWQTLVDKLKEAARQAGARVLSGVRVETVLRSGAQVSGVRLSDGSELFAGRVIIATSPQEAIKLVGKDSAPALRAAVDSLLPAPLACMDVALSRLPNRRYPVVQDMDSPCFLTTQSLFARLAPPEGAVIHLFKPLDPRRPADPRRDERDLENLLDAVQPGWRDVVVRRNFLPRMEGASLLPTASTGGMAGRPDPRAAGIDGLYLAGDWIGPEGFLADAVFASARQAARLAVEDFHKTGSLAESGGLRAPAGLLPDKENVVVR